MGHGLVFNCVKDNITIATEAKIGTTSIRNVALLNVDFNDSNYDLQDEIIFLYRNPMERFVSGQLQDLNDNFFEDINSVDFSLQDNIDKLYDVYLNHSELVFDGGHSNINGINLYDRYHYYNENYNNIKYVDIANFNSYVISYLSERINNFNTDVVTYQNEQTETKINRIKQYTKNDDRFKTIDFFDNITNPKILKRLNKANTIYLKLKT